MPNERRILLLTNDDGIDAPGLRVLQEAAVTFGECRVVGPAKCWSGCGHVATTGEPFRVVDRGEGRIVVEGTPVDCVRVALHHLAADAEWVLAGVNAGANLGADVYHSGTAAAAREGVLLGKRAVAISHYIAKGRSIDWPQTTRWVLRVLRWVFTQPAEPGVFWNINLPHPETDAAEPEIVECPLDPSPLPLRYELAGEHVQYAGDYHRRERLPGSDVDVCFRGQIAATPIRLVEPWASRFFEERRTGLAEGGQRHA